MTGIFKMYSPISIKTLKCVQCGNLARSTQVHLFEIASRLATPWVSSAATPSRRDRSSCVVSNPRKCSPLQSIVRVCLLLFGLVAFITLILNDARGQSFQTVLVAPPVPIEGRPFVLELFGYYFGGPVGGGLLQVENQEISISDENLTWTLYVRLASSNLGPAGLQSQMTVGSTSARARTLRVYVRHHYINQPYSDPNLIYEGSVQTAGLSSVPVLVEYFNAPRKHYFQSIDPIEIAALDAGVFPDWTQTGQRYRVYASRIAPSGNSSPLVPVCRYYGKPSYGLDTHFFSAFEFECDAISVLFQDQWIEESRNAYWVYLPNFTVGSCPYGTIRIYRSFNAKPDVNHRYTSTTELRDSMAAQGWISEGVSNGAVGMCAVPE